MSTLLLKKNLKQEPETAEIWDRK